jgi:hypothetical protein
VTGKQLIFSSADIAKYWAELPNTVINNIDWVNISGTIDYYI